jgi:hypothetical protein
MMQDAVISPGPPPLTLSAADGAIDLIDFMAAAVRGVDTIDVTPAMRESWRSYLAQYYPMLPPPDRMWFANASFMLAQIHQGWAQLSEQQRTATVQAWSTILPAILQFAAPVLGQGAAAQPGMMPGAMPGMPAAAPQAYPAQPQAYPAAAPGYAPQPQADDWSNKSAAELVEIMNAEAQKRVAEASKLGPEAAAEQQAFNEQMALTTLTNMASMRNQALMAVANNFKA